MNATTQAKPLVSIIMAAYRHQDYVAAAIRGVISQTWENIELLIIDDGSPDGTAAAIRELESACRERFVRFEFRSRSNQGLLPTLNEGLEWAQGEYLCTTASDDILLPEKTALQVTYLQAHPECLAVFGSIDRIDARGEPLPVEKNDHCKSASYGFGEILRRDAFLLAPTQLMRRSAVMAVGGYDTRFLIEDWYMWLRLTEDGARLHVMPETMALYRQHGANFSRRALIMLREERKLLDLYADRPDSAGLIQAWDMEAFVVCARLDKRAALRLLPKVWHRVTDPRLLRGLAKLFLAW